MIAGGAHAHVQAQASMGPRAGGRADAGAANGLTIWPVEAALLGGWGGRLATASG